MAAVTVDLPNGETTDVHIPDTNVPSPNIPYRILSPVLAPVPLVMSPLASASQVAAVLPPSEGDTVSLDEVYAWYREFLGRDPDFETEAKPRVGNPKHDTYVQIRCSEEAAAYRAAHGAEPDTYCIPSGPVPTPPAIYPQKPPSAPPTVKVPGGIDLGGLGAFLQQVADALGGLKDHLGEQLSKLSNDVGDGMREIQANIESSLGKLTPVIGNAFNALNAKIGQVVQGLIPTTLSLIGTALGGVEGIVSAFVNNAASIDDIIGAVTKTLSDKKVDVGTFISIAVGAAFESGLNGAIDVLTKDHPEIAEATIDRVLAVEGLSEHARTLLETGKDREHSPGALAAIGILLSVLVGMSGAMAEPDIENARQFAWQSNPTRTFDSGTAAELVARGFADDSTGQTLARIDGLRPELWRAALNLRRKWPEVEQLFMAHFRGAVSEDDVNIELHHLGYDETARAQLWAIAPNIPNVSDVLRFLVRDVFIPEFVEAFGMDKEYPSDADVWAAKLGIPHEVMQLHWRAHWELPSVSQGYEMFQRSKIDEVALRRLLRAQGVEPYWRDPLIAISYNPLTRIDLRRMDRVGTITDDQLLRGYLDVGYSPEQAKLLFDFTKALNKKDKKRELADLTDSQKGRVVGAVVSGTITEKEGTELLREIGYADAEIAAFVAEARLFRQEAISKKVADLIGRLFIEGHRTETEARAALSEHGYIPSEVDLILREWTLEKELRAPTEAKLRERDLSVSNVLTAYEEGSWTEAEARDYLKKLRLDDKEVAALMASVKYRIAKQEEKESIEAVHVAVLSGRSSEADASATLSTLNVPSKKRDALLAKWSLERHGKVEKIPLSSLKDILARGVWDDAKMKTYLRETGYSDDDIEALLVLWGSQAAEKAAREATAKAKIASKIGKGGTSA